MKWVYIPTMFALAFFYTKFSFNDLGHRSIDSDSSAPPPVAPTVSGVASMGRGPASVSTKNKKNSVGYVLKKVPANILYKHLNDPVFMAPFKKLMDFPGTIVGDLHVESFGFVIDDKKRAIFSVREFRELTEGLLLYDVMAHLISAKTLDKKVTWINYFEAYKSGLQDRPRSYSYYIEKGIDEALVDTDKILDENITQEAPFEFSKLGKSYHHVDAAKKTIIVANIRKKYPKAEILDLYEQDAAFKTYQVLLRVRPQDKVEWLELSETNRTDYDAAFAKGSEVDFEKRYVLLKLVLFDGRLNESLNAVVIENKSYVMKFAEHFSSKLDLRAIPADDYCDVVMDEAYTLGKIHRRSLDSNVDDYIKNWAAIPGAVVDEKAVELKYKFKDLLEEK